MRRLAPAAALALSACAAAPPPTSTAPAPAALGLDGTDWSLVSLGGEAVTAPVSLVFAGDRASGQGPCNRYFGAWTEGPGGALAIGPVAATRAACPDLALEERFLAALTDAARGARAGATLTLLAADGAELMRLSGG